MSEQEQEFPTLQDLLDTWQAWSTRDTFTRLAAGAGAAGDQERAARLRQQADAAAVVSAVQALAAQHELASLMAGWQWQTVRAAREDGASWAEIAQAIGTGAIRARE